MSFQAPISIARAVQSVHERKYVLPNIQREFEWSTRQIESLFDSVMRGYPIGSFLFWRVERRRVRDFQFYDFIRDFHSRDNRHNPKADVRGNGEVTAILDGQQRLTALYLGLRGSHTERRKYARRNDPSAYTRKRLYIDLLDAPPEEEGQEWSFYFLTDAEAVSSDKEHWFRVGDALDMAASASAPNDYLTQRHMADSPVATSALFRLVKAVNDELTVNYYLEEQQSLERVLDIFIRTNSGGTPLTYPQILMSMATTQWRQLDAREEILALVDELNRIGDGFAFTRDFVLKACLVMSNASDIRFRVTNFTGKNSKAIEAQWASIKRALLVAVRLVDSFGFDARTLTSNNALIPIAYHVMHAGLPDRVVTATSFGRQRDAIERWLLVSLLRGVFGQSGDTVLAATRQVLRKAGEMFPSDELFARTRVAAFDDAEISEILLTARYGQSRTYPLLALLYPTLDKRNLFHQDHLLPKSVARAELRQLRLTDIETAFVRYHVDDIANLQLIEGTPNQEKSARPFEEWVHASFRTESTRTAYRKTHMVPTAIRCDPSEFDAFLKARRRLMFGRLRKVLPAPLPSVEAPEPACAGRLFMRPGRPSASRGHFRGGLSSRVWPALPRQVDLKSPPSSWIELPARTLQMAVRSGSVVLVLVLSDRIIFLQSEKDHGACGVQIGSFRDLADDVDEHGGLGVYVMGTLRDLHGAGKLGKYVRQSISEQLSAHGLGHLPPELPIYQEQIVRVYRTASSVGRAVTAVLHPTNAGDDFLRSIDGDESRELLDQIKRLVGR